MSLMTGEQQNRARIAREAQCLTTFSFPPFSADPILTQGGSGELMILFVACVSWTGLPQPFKPCSPCIPFYLFFPLSSSLSDKK